MAELDLDALKPGDDVLVHGTLLEVSKDAWGPKGIHLYKVRIVTGDSGSEDIYASWVEPAGALEWNKRARALISYLHRELQDFEIGGDEVLPAERALLRLAGVWPEEESDG